MQLPPGTAGSNDASYQRATHACTKRQPAGIKLREKNAKASQLPQVYRIRTVYRRMINVYGMYIAVTSQLRFSLLKGKSNQKSIATAVLDQRSKQQRTRQSQDQREREDRESSNNPRSSPYI